MRTKMLFGALMTAATPPAAFAQSASAPDVAAQADDGVPDIVVTATRREERLQDVPIAVSAFSAEAINNLSARQIGDVAFTTPNLARTSGPTGGNDAFFFIRGIGQVDSNPANDPGVGVYIDGVYLGRLQGASLDVQDVQRIEVLRGPQGTLFGRNTIGGAISVTTADPGREPQLLARMTVGSRNRFDGYISASAPITDTLGVRLSFSGRNQDGWSTNFYTGQTYGDIQDLSFRGKVVWRPTDRFSLVVNGDWFQARGGNAPTILLGFAPNTGPIPNIQRLGLPFPVPAVGTTPLGVPFPPDLLADRLPNLGVNFASNPARLDNDNHGVSATAALELDPFTLKTILSYRSTRQVAANDFDATGYRLFDNFFRTRSQQYSAEVQLLGGDADSRFSWILGGFAYYEDIAHINQICLGTNLGQPFPGRPGGPTRNAGGCLQNNQAFGLEITNFAGFGNLTWRMTDKLSAVVGGRYTTEQKVQAFDFFLNNSAGVASLFNFPTSPNIPTLSPRNPALTIPTTYNNSWAEFTPKVGLNYQANDDVLIYASYSRGFKSGGFNGRPNPGPGGFQEIQAFDPETLDAFELGLKSEWFDRRLRFNLAGFYSIYDGIQLLVLDPRSGFFNNANAGTNHIKGFEIETQARPIRNLELYLNAGYLDTEYVRINPAAGIPRTARLPVTPDWTIGAGGSYRFDLGRFGSLTPRADVTYRGRVAYNAPNAPLEQERPITLLNLRLTYADPDERFTVAAFGLNVTDIRYLSNASDVRRGLGVAFGQVAPPAEWGVEVATRF